MIADDIKDVYIVKAIVKKTKRYSKAIDMICDYISYDYILYNAF